MAGSLWCEGCSARSRWTLSCQRMTLWSIKIGFDTTFFPLPSPILSQIYMVLSYFKLTHWFILKNSWSDGGPWGYPNEVIPTGPNRERSQWRSSSGEEFISFNIFLPSSIWIATGQKALTLHQGNIWGKLTTGVSGPRTRYIVLLPDSCWIALSLLGSGTGKVPFNLLLWLQL